MGELHEEAGDWGDDTQQQCPIAQMGSKLRFSYTL